MRRFASARCWAGACARQGFWRLRPFTPEKRRRLEAEFLAAAAAGLALVGTAEVIFADLEGGGDSARR